MPKKKHRGRFQAQGDGLEASESWAQDEPLSKSEGLKLLAKLKNKLPEKEVKKRAYGFKKAEEFVKNTKGGVSAPIRKSFAKPENRKVRVDLEVQSGIAFVLLILVVLICLIIF